MQKQLLLAVVLLASPLAFAQAPTAAPQFAQILGDFANAINAKDPAAAAAFFASDGQVLPPGGDVVTGHAAIEKFYKTGTDAGNTLTVTTVASQSSGGLGYETGTVVVSAKDAKGRPVKINGKYVSIFVQENGAWKVKYLCYNTSPSRSK